jgi:hypothetical protein
MRQTINAARQAQASFARARDLLVHDPVGILGSPDGAGPKRRRFPADLSVQVGRTGVIHVQVEIEIRAVHLDADSARWDMTWHAIDHPRLFPVFEGTLALEPAERGGTIVRMTGSYEPPFGPVGAVGDGVMRHRVAHTSIERYLGSIAGNIDRTVTEQMASEPAPLATHDALRP